LKTITQIKNYTFYAVLFTLPMYTRLNNIFLFIFFALFLLEGQFGYKWANLKRHYKAVIPLAPFFLLALIASLNHPGDSIFKHLEKYWSFLLIPITIISCLDYYSEKWRELFEALFLGSIITLVICYSNVAYEMLSKEEPLHYFLRWRHLNHEFTAIADTHPAYLGVFIVCSIVFILLEATYKKLWKIVAIVFLSLALVQLASRIAILSFVIVTIIFLLSKVKRKWKEILIGLAIVGVFGTFLYYSASSFLKDRLISVESFENDERFSRHKVSFEIFKEYPIFGIGFARKDEIRIEKYNKYGFTVAAQEKYNAHNQLFEYLSINGIIGGLSYILVALYLLYTCWKRQSLFYFLILVIFFVANITESMLVRIKGIEFLAITVSLLMTIKMKEKNE